VVDIEKVKGRAEQLKGEVEQAVGRATGSLETQGRGVVDEAKGTVRAKVAELKGIVEKQAGEASERVAELKGKA